MNIAVTNHAVERYQLRVPTASKLERESVRVLIRDMVTEAFENHTVRDHPGFPDRRMVPFSVGAEKLFLALGPNETEFPGEWAVIGVLYDRELGKKGGVGTIGDLIPDSVKQQLAEGISKTPPKPSKYLVRIGSTKEVYDVKDDEDLEALIHRRMPRPDEVEIFERKTFTIKQVYVIEKAK